MPKPMRPLSVLLVGLAFPECPRWRDGKLFFSDMHACKVMTVDLAGMAAEVVEVPGRPSGLGWLPDGRMLVVSMLDRQLMRLDGGTLEVHADLSGLASGLCNDMVTDSAGRAYVGNFGFDFYAGEPQKPAELIIVAPDGSANLAADDLQFPNGSVISPDGKTLIVGESYGRRLTAFQIRADGTLADQRTWADLGDCIPDGIALDAEGAIWAASPNTSAVIRVFEGGYVAERIPTRQPAFACALGGDDRKTLFILSAESWIPETCRTRRTGRIEVAEVDVEGAGFP